MEGAVIVIDAYGERKAEESMRDTWGHLDAEPWVRYPGHIVFTQGIYGDDHTMALSVEFGSAGYGPWFYEGITDFLADQEIEPGTIYRFDGYYRLEGESHNFVGQIIEIASY